MPLLPLRAGCRLASSWRLALALLVGFALAPAALAQPGFPGTPGEPSDPPGFPGDPGDGEDPPGFPGDPPDTRQLDVRVLLQGAYDGSLGMRTDLHDDGLVPLTQPYSDPVFDGTVLDYDGAETSTAFVFSFDDIVDWVLVELRASPTAPPIARAAALLLDDGSLRAPEGGPFELAGVPASAYLVVRHRNHAAAMTATAVVLTERVDFTREAETYGTGGTTRVGTKGPMMLWAGDGTGDGLVTAPDFNTYASASAAGATGYRIEDYTLDGLVTAPDFNVYAASAAVGASSAVPEN